MIYWYICKVHFHYPFPNDLNEAKFLKTFRLFLHRWGMRLSWASVSTLGTKVLVSHFWFGYGNYKKKALKDGAALFCIHHPCCLVACMPTNIQFNHNREQHIDQDDLYDKNICWDVLYESFNTIDLKL